MCHMVNRCNRRFLDGEDRVCFECPKGVYMSPKQIKKTMVDVKWRVDATVSKIGGRNVVVHHLEGPCVGKYPVNLSYIRALFKLGWARPCKRCFKVEND